MRTDSKKYYDVPEELLKKLSDKGYSELMPEQQEMFNPYYDAMDGHWCANTSFLNLWGWRDACPAYYRKHGDHILLVQYLREEGYPIASPCLGHYTKENVAKLIAELKSDFEYFGYPLIFMDITPWMLPFYEDNGVDFEVEDLRDLQDYTYTPEQFFAGMESQDDRYRYRYFKRKYEYETLEITPDLYDECHEFMEEHWCGNKTCEECYCGCLKKVVENVVADFDKFRAYGILVRVDGKAAGICIVTARNKLGIYQYKNAINRIKGLNEYLLRECFERYMGDVDMINYTEDMGVESLRYYKQHLAPEYTLLSKYTLREKVK